MNHPEPRFPERCDYFQESEYQDAIEAYYDRLDEYEHWAADEVDRAIDERDWDAMS